MRRVAVTGASGLIGGSLTKFLEQRGDLVIPVGRKPPDHGVRWNPDSGQIDEHGLRDVDAVVHLAGERIDGRWTTAKKARIMDSRVKGTELLADALTALDQRPEVVISASAIGIYGSRGDEALFEESEPGTGFLAEVCRRWEEAAAPISTSDTRLVLLRTGIVCTRQGGAFARMLALTRMGLGGRLGSGEQWWSWITLQDQVRAIAHLLDSPLGGAVNLVAPGCCRNAEFTQTLARATRRPAVIPAPAAALRIALGQMADDLLLASTRVRPARLKDSGFEFAAPDLASAIRGILKG